MPIRLAEFLSPRPEEPLWSLIRQAGVTDVVALLQGAEQEQRMFAAVGEGTRGTDGTDAAPWSEASIARDQRIFADAGFRVAAIEDTVPMDRIRLGREGRDEDIAAVIQQLEAMGNLGIGVLCFNWMAIATWSRTSIETVGRGGARVTSFRLADAGGHPDVEVAETAEDLWAALAYFLDAVIPTAERAGVRLGMHPDDPPLPRLRGVPRIMGTPDAYRRLLALNPSRANGVTFCQGNFALMPGADDVPGLIREFGERVAFSHFRNVRGTAEDFVETFHDEGVLDMAECMRALADIGFDGPLRPDHVPTMAGEPNARPGYETLGRLHALGYIRGLMDAVGA
ncbi:mannonate dehydratase [Homoserinibacter sp. YIM 151385]|uniref:mannonate dehydratase n=1 Tax=Homoserinibacter sp. YIM 151385 TaxID=2985506 RepID=UPI0022F0C236|nr:mannonate dehydratase [Homoserinibacter sp. YIM 151385]WBU37521.1 mannonate dehydratase [Homoserinibacter sp. YIM 151385]